ncbi:D-galactarolactone cycloisomerase [Palleronia aestuarii]|uniref:D-galactarolactone cycloisomerase n=1 Tax=Palleronia aestuarii TaxID=568105 RepID=A0A2W7NP10_9RHOB|nr:mandelate racemase/muconate lactonizing enzyme family protein [Palleronia aestuarii]PZX13012.1 D-galactarolactone cycloisomerase [Palleronia aestuarii]
MKIDLVRTHVLDTPMEVPYEAATMKFSRRTHTLVEIVCDDGTTGWGECLGPAWANAAIVETYAGWLTGSNPLETEKTWSTLYSALRHQGQRGLTVTALSGIDIALWDIKGKHFGVPISTLMGGRFREEVQAYATGAFKREGVDRVEDNALDMERHKSDGFKAAKIKIGFDVEEDMRVIAAVREVMGDGMDLMIDANNAYDVLESLDVGRRAAEYGVKWFEEPVVPEQLDAYDAVRAGQPLPVAGGETWHTRWGMYEALRRRSVDILQPDVGGCGGFTEAKRIHDLASLFGIRVIPHVWGTAVQIAAALQFIAAMPPDPVRGAPIAPMLEFDRTEHPFQQTVLTTPLVPHGGMIAIPDGPGLGIEIDRATLADATTREAR